MLWCIIYSVLRLSITPSTLNFLLLTFAQYGNFWSQTTDVYGTVLGYIDISNSMPRLDYVSTYVYDSYTFPCFFFLHGIHKYSCLFQQFPEQSWTAETVKKNKLSWTRTYIKKGFFALSHLPYLHLASTFVAARILITILIGFNIF